MRKRRKRKRRRKLGERRGWVVHKWVKVTKKRKKTGKRRESWKMGVKNYC